MRTFKHLFVLLSSALLTFTSVSCHAQDSGSSDGGKRLFSLLSSKYGTEKVMVAAFFTTDCMEAYKQMVSVDHTTHYCTLEEELSAYYDSGSVEGLTYCLKSSDSASVVKWCELDIRLNQVDITSDGQSSFESVLYTMTNGKPFFKPYLDNENQYYGSLTFSQSCALYFDVINYLVMDASALEQEAFLTEYYARYHALNGE